jgi:cell wall-associated NlpC family hydrolase
VIRNIACAVPVCLFLFASSATAEDVVDRAARLIGRPYVWGAEGPDSFDCSGLTQYVYQQVGIDLPRRAIHQSQFGDAVGRGIQRGDLLFFANDSRRSLVTHVGIYEGERVMIDASKRHGRVRRDHLDDPFWVERFMFARRVALSADPDRTSDPTSRSRDRRTTTIRIIERIAGEIFKRPK